MVFDKVKSVPNLLHKISTTKIWYLETGAPAATRPTMMEVEVDEDWTTTVTSTPSITPTTGLEIRSDSKKT